MMEITATIRRRNGQTRLGGKPFMKRLIISALMCLCLFWTMPAWPQDPLPGEPKTGTLTVIVDGFRNDQGDVKIGLSNSPAGYKNEDEALRRAALPVRNGKVVWVLTDLPWGKYSLKAYHDENGNGKLDRNAAGMPREAYGFSNNVRGVFGPPDFAKTLFQFDKTDMTMRITVK